MSCVKNSVCKLCRRENTKLFLKGDRCFTDKCSLERRPYPPGQHGQQRLKFSEFALQLREKQKAKRYYGLSESQFSKYVTQAGRSKELTGTALLKLLEMRLDNVVYTLGFANSRREARQLVSHNQLRVQSAAQAVARRTIPSWLEADHANFVGKVKDLPSRDEVSLPVEENVIVEYYSR